MEYLGLRVPKGLAERLREESEQTGIPMQRIMRSVLMAHYPDYSPAEDMGKVLIAPTPSQGEARLVPLSQGRFAIVDEDDFADVTQHQWHFAQGQARRTVWVGNQARKQTLPRYLLGLPNRGGKIVFRDGDPLNCRRENLYYVTEEEGHDAAGHPARLDVTDTGGVAGSV